MWHVQAQDYFALPEAPSGNQLATIEYGGAWTWEERAWVARPPYADIGGSAVEGMPGIQTIELYVTPFDELRLQDAAASRASLLAAGRVIGFSLSGRDVDTSPGNYRALLTLAGQTDTWRSADEFVDGVLIGCDVEDCGSLAGDPSAVASVSWGRVKAAVSGGWGGR